MNKYAIYNTVDKGDNNAGSKAGRDAVDIAVRNGYQFVALYRAKGTHTTIGNVISGYLHVKQLCRKLKAGDIVFLQYPVNRQLMKEMYRLFNKKKVHTVTLIHDVDYLRDVPFGDQGVEGMKARELSILSQSEYLICHNPSMIAALQKENLQAKFISLELFDYLYQGDDAKQTTDGSVIVAGNLAEQKAGYIYKLQDQQFKLSLYGSNLSESFANANAVYHGSFAPDELIANLEGAFGLVWDGSEVDTCAGSYGKYLRLNNPHKVSLYMAAGLPVVVWKESALYPFVVDNGVGFGVDSLLDVDDEMKKHDYASMAQNVKAVQTKVRAGGFLKAALSKMEEMI